MRKLLSLALVALVSASVGRAQTILTEFDFFNSGGTTYKQPFYTNYTIMQTFKATADWSVSSVDFTIDQAATTTNGLTVWIYDLAEVWPKGLQPTGTALSSGFLAADDPQFNTFLLSWKNVTMSPVNLTAGTTYGLVVYAGGGDQEYDWYSKFGSEMYADGNMSVNNTGTFAQQSSYDVPFRINGTVIPEPSTYAMLFGAAALGLAVWRRRR